MADGASNRLARLRAIKCAGQKFSVLTCYDAVTAALMAQAGIDCLLVGDTAGEVILGLPSTRGVPVDFLIALTAAVRRGAPDAVVLADLPWVCRTEGDTATVRWCRRFQDETGCDAVKIEVTGSDAALVESVGRAGVPVVAHLGLLPQTVDPRAGYRAQGRDADAAARLLADAMRLEQAGAAMLLLEAVASEAAGEIARRTPLPVIGCVAGPHCDGTVVVLHDLLGLGAGHPPKAVKRYANLADAMVRAFRAYGDDVRAGRFPVEQDAIHMKPGEYERLHALAGGR